MDRAAAVTRLHEMAEQLGTMLPRRQALMHGGKEWHLAVYDSRDGVRGPEERWVTIDSDVSLAALLLRQYDRERLKDGRRRPRQPSAAAEADRGRALSKVSR